MSRALILGVLVWGVAIGSAAAEGFADCVGRSPDAERLKCFDAAAQGGSSRAEDPKTPTTKEIVATKPSDPPQVVDPSDLFVSPRKFKGKAIELRNARCFHADANDYRCLAPGASVVLIGAPSISPDEAQAQIEKDCGQIRKIQTAACRKTLRFVVREVDDDQVNAMTRRVTVVAPVIEIVAAAGKKR